MSQSFSLPNPIADANIPIGYCNNPFNLNSKVEGNLVSLSWTSPHDNDGFYLNYWITGQAPVQLTIFGSGTQLSLLPGTVYNWSVRTMCNRGGNIGSDTVIGAPFTTGQEALQCPMIDISNALVIKTGKAARLEWTAVPRILSYQVELKYGSGMPIVFTTTSNYLNLNILIPNTEYSWRVKPNCLNKISNFSNWSIFTTLLGDSCPPVEIKGVLDITTAIYYWTNNEAAKSYQVYLNGSLIASEHPVNIITFHNLNRLMEYTLIVIPNCPDGPGEMASLTASTRDYPVANPTNLTGNFLNGNVVITWSPAENITGQEIMINGSFQELPADQNSFTVVNPPPNSKIGVTVKSVGLSGKSTGAHANITVSSYCQSVKQAIVHSTTQNSIRVVWPLTTGVDKYRVRRRLAAGVSWVVDYTTSTDYTFTNLQFDTEYIIEVTAVCGNNTSVPVLILAKTDPQAECPIPIDIVASQVTDTSVVVGFGLSNGKVPYEGRYCAVVDDGIGTLFNIGSESPILIEGLDPDTDYSVYVYNMCSEETFNFPTSVSEIIAIKTKKACGPVTSLAAALQTDNTKLYTSWVAVAGAVDYTVKYRELGAVDWINHSTSAATNRTITGIASALYEVMVITNYGDDRTCYATTVIAIPKVLNVTNPDPGWKATIIWDEILHADGYLVTVANLSGSFTVKTTAPSLKLILDADTTYSIYVQAIYDEDYGTASDDLTFNTGNPLYENEDDICSDPPIVEAFFQDSSVNNPSLTPGDNYDITVKVKNYNPLLRYEIQLIKSGEMVPVVSRIIEASDPNFDGSQVFRLVPFLDYVAVVLNFNNLGLLCDVVETVRSTTCDKPVNLAYSNLTDIEFTVDWDAVTNALRYEVYLDGVLHTSVVNNHYDFTNMNPETKYEVTVKAVCGDLLRSPISDPLTVMTNPTA